MINTWKNIKKSYKNNKFKILGPTRNDKFECCIIFFDRYSRLFSVCVKKIGKKTNNPPKTKYANQIE